MDHFCQNLQVMSNSEDSTAEVATGPFGSALVEQMVSASWRNGAWSKPIVGPVEPLRLHPAAHALHYGSACFEGLKAHRGDDGIVRVFRLDQHVRRLQDSARALVLPVPDAEMLTEMVVRLVRSSLASVPAAPGSLYVRPTLIGTEANIGAATRPSSEALLYVLASPVGDYFTGGGRPLMLAVNSELPRTTPQFGKVKAGANYAMALRTTIDANVDLGVDQVLFAPNGLITETGASNVLLLDGRSILTPALESTFLHGVTRDSILALASDLGYRIEERPVSVDDLVDWVGRPTAEVALSGTAAVLAGVGSISYRGQRHQVGDGLVGERTTELRRALTDTLIGRRPDLRGWLTAVPQ